MHEFHDADVNEGVVKFNLFGFAMTKFGRYVPYVSAGFWRLELDTVGTIANGREPEYREGILKCLDAAQKDYDLRSKKD